MEVINLNEKEIKNIISLGENVNAEFKIADSFLPKNLFEQYVLF